MRIWKWVLIASALLFGVAAPTVLLSAPVSARAIQANEALYTLQFVAPIPGYTSAACYDIAVVDHHTLYLTSATNKAVAIINEQKVSLLGQGLFTGIGGCHQFDFSQEGPTGVLVEHGLLWAGDGNSTVKVFRLADHRLLATIATGSPANRRADEIEYLPTVHQVVVANPDAAPTPFLTYIDARTLKVVARQNFPEATAGLEQPRFSHGLLLLAIPATQANPGGEIDAIDPRTHFILRRYGLSNCGASGLTVIDDIAATGCANGPDQLINLHTGKVTIIAGSGAADMVAGDPEHGYFFFASYAISGVFVTDQSGRILQTIPTDASAHSVAVDEETGKLYVPVGSMGGVAEFRLDH